MMKQQCMLKKIPHKLVNYMFLQRETDYKGIERDILVLETGFSLENNHHNDHDLEDLLLDLPTIKRYAECQVGHIDSVFIRSQN